MWRAKCLIRSAPNSASFPTRSPSASAWSRPCASFRERVGFEGLHLLSVSLSIQAKTGGNLTEILSNLSTVLRERQKLRMKIRALSAEGRLSAMDHLAVSARHVRRPAHDLAPSYYGDVWDNPLIMPVFMIFGAWALLGDFIMYRMVNFDF